MQALWKTAERFLKKLKIELTYDPMKTLIEKDTCTVFFAVVFTIATVWKQPKRPSEDKGIEGMRC